MKYLITGILIISSLFVQAQKKDSTISVNTEIKLQFKNDTIYRKIIYIADLGIVRADSGYVVLSGYGNESIKGFWSSEPEKKFYIYKQDIKTRKRIPTELKEEDFITVK